METAIFADMFDATLLIYITAWIFSLADMSPTALLLSENGEIPSTEVTLLPGDEYSGAAPLEFRFISANNSEPVSSNFRYEWQFARDVAFSDLFLTRFDAETIYSFQETGIFYVRLITTNLDTEETFQSDAFIIRIAESELDVPNAFSPNGDGVNDLFKVKHKSLVCFEAVVFNRWGQELHRWNLSNIDVGWDGSAHGNQVPEGVYFIVVNALGADGISYRIKRDINILR